jgi:hypothetical protein
VKADNTTLLLYDYHIEVSLALIHFEDRIPYDLNETPTCLEHFILHTLMKFDVQQFLARILTCFVYFNAI